MRNYKNIFIDLDGTIINSHEGVVKSLKYSLDKMGIKNYDEKVLDTFIGPPLTLSFAVKFSMGEEDIKKAIAFYRERYSTKGMYECHAYQGLEQTLIEMKNSGKRLYVATSKPLHFAKLILDNLDLSKHFDGIYGADLSGAIHEKEDVIEHAFKNNPELLKEETLMVGDTMYDIIGANKTGLDSMGVLYGFGKEEDFKEHRATYIVKTTADIAKEILYK
ncbi:MAG: HAD hydrolase-like protein [Clostridia bacterium]